MLNLAGGEKTRRGRGVADVAMLSFYWIQGFYAYLFCVNTQGKKNM